MWICALTRFIRSIADDTQNSVEIFWICFLDFCFLVYFRKIHFCCVTCVSLALSLLITLPNNLLNPIIIYYAYSSATTTPNHLCINRILLRELFSLLPSLSLALLFVSNFFSSSLFIFTGSLVCVNNHRSHTDTTKTAAEIDGRRLEIVHVIRERKKLCVFGVFGSVNILHSARFVSISKGSMFAQFVHTSTSRSRTFHCLHSLRPAFQRVLFLPLVFQN